ncbi:MAG: hypothetical protein IKF83_02390 [Clostridia bacterium]|nr:hypothetical protein [Clostridia bacterium]
MQFVLEQTRTANTYDKKPDTANYDVNIRNISYTTLRLPKREIENIKWLFSGDIS